MRAQTDNLASISILSGRFERTREEEICIILQYQWTSVGMDGVSWNEEHSLNMSVLTKLHSSSFLFYSITHLMQLPGSKRLLLRKKELIQFLIPFCSVLSSLSCFLPKISVCFVSCSSLSVEDTRTNYKLIWRLISAALLKSVASQNSLWPQTHLLIHHICFFSLTQTLFYPFMFISVVLMFSVLNHSLSKLIFFNYVHTTSQMALLLRNPQFLVFFAFNYCIKSSKTQV